LIGYWFWLTNMQKYIRHIERKRRKKLVTINKQL